MTAKQAAQSFVRNLTLAIMIYPVMIIAVKTLVL